MTAVDHSAWVHDLLSELDNFGPESKAAAAYLRGHKTRVSVHGQPTGARWTADRRIEIHPRYASLSPDDPYAISLVIHEVKHLQQGVFTALSVYGELEAWQLQFRFLKWVTGRYHADPVKRGILEDLMSQPLGWDRSVLGRIPGLMQAYAGKGYHIDWLPLYPLHREILYRTARQKPSDTAAPPPTAH